MPEYTADQKEHIIYDELENRLQGLKLDTSPEVLLQLEEIKTATLAKMVVDGVITEGEYGIQVRVVEQPPQYEEINGVPVLSAVAGWSHAIFIYPSESPPPEEGMGGDAPTG